MAGKYGVHLVSLGITMERTTLASYVRRGAHMGIMDKNRDTTDAMQGRINNYMYNRNGKRRISSR